ncbi:MAG: hypothetical protein IPF42_13475 [Candidatus Microthrix sp.]|nr:hypothetical protein [Candidatus Microthrix sp.]
MNWPRFVANGSSAYVFGATVLSATFVCAGVWVAWRSWGRRIGIVVATCFILLVSTTGWGYVTSPWNPMVGVLGVPLLVVVAAAAWDGDVLASAVSVAVASLLVQSHVGNAGVCLAILVALAVGQWRRVEARPDLLKAWGTAAGTAVVLWMVPGLQQLTSGRDGNMWRIVQFSRNSTIPRTGLGDALQAGMRAFRPRPAWLGASNVYEGVTDHGRPLWLLAPVAVAILMLWGHRGGSSGRATVVGEGDEPTGERVARRLLGIATVGWAAAIVMLGLGRGPVRVYYAVHIESLAAVICVSSLSYLALRGLRAWRDRRDSSTLDPKSSSIGGLLPVVALAGVVAFASLTTRSLQPQHEGSDYFLESVDAVKTSVATSSGSDGRVVISQASPEGVSNEEFSFAMGFIAALNRSGVNVAAGHDIDSESGDSTGSGLQLAVPPSLWVDAPRAGDLAVALFSGKERASRSVAGHLESSERNIGGCPSRMIPRHAINLRESTYLAATSNSAATRGLLM